MKKLISLKIDEGDLAELRRISKELDRSMSWIVREAIRSYLRLREL